MSNNIKPLTIRDEAFNLCKDVFKDKITDCFLYGSYARGDYTPDSDVDIVMIVDCNFAEINLFRREISCINSDLSLKYDVTVSITVQPKALFEQYSDILPFYTNIKKEGIRYAV